MLPGRKSEGKRGGKRRPAKNPRLPAEMAIIKHTRNIVLRSNGASTTLSPSRPYELCESSSQSLRSEELIGAYLLFLNGSQRPNMLVSGNTMMQRSSRVCCESKIMPKYEEPK